MTTTLAQIENQTRASIRLAARKPQPSSPLRGFMIALLVTPFLIIETLFVLFFGQALVFLALLLTAKFLHLKRSWSLLAATLSGAIVSAVAITIISTASEEFARRGLYFFMLSATIVTVTYIIFIAGAMIAHYERARVGLGLANGGVG